MEWSLISFGKYKGKSLPQIIFKDADWFFNGYEKGYFKGVLAQEAHELYRRARSIRIPQRNGQKLLVEYHIHHDGKSGKGKFGMMQLITDGFALGRMNVASSIDFYVPRSLATYDKTGYKDFVSMLKAILFGNSSRRMNRRACEAFFNDEANFDLN
jgi:hypothetical protein